MARPGRTSARQAARGNANNDNGNNNGTAPGTNDAPSPGTSTARGRRAGNVANPVAARPTVAGMRVLQEQLEAQQREAAELRDQLRETVANLNVNRNNNGGGGGQNQPEDENQNNPGQQQQGAGGRNAGMSEGLGRQGQEDSGTGESQHVAALRMDMNDRFTSILAAIKETQQQRAGPGPVPPFGTMPNVTQPLNSQSLFGMQSSYGLPPMGAIGGTPAGGESEIAVHFTGLAKKDLANIMEGNIEPSKIYQAIPTDSDLYPKPDLEEKARLEMDNKGQLVVLDNSKAQEDERQFKRLIGTLPDALNFMLAWSWFVTLTSYHYKSPPLSAAMMRFGWRVVAYSRVYPWDTVLRVYVKLATPLLHGRLLQVSPYFDSVSFADAIGSFQATSQARVTLTSASAVVSKPNGGPFPTPAQTSMTKSSSAPQICLNFNKGYCGRQPCRYMHMCSVCGNYGHPSVQCFRNGAATSPANNAGDINNAAAGPSMHPSRGNFSTNNQAQGRNA